MTEEPPPAGVHQPGARPEPTARVLQPAGASPAAADRLDPDPRLRTGEVLVRLEGLWLDHEAETAVARSSGGVPERMRAALLEATTERGALPPGFAGTVLVGRVAERSDDGAAVGTRIAVTGITGLPLWLRDVSGWTGGRLVPADGHAVVPTTVEVLEVDEAPPTAAVGAVAAVAHLPALVEHAARLRPSGDVVVLGGGSVGGALAVAAARAAGRRAIAAVSTLGEARTARALGAELAPIVPSGPPGEAAHALATEVADGSGVEAPAIVVVADATPGAAHTAGLVAARWGAVVVVARPADAAAVTSGAAGGGCSPVVLAGRTLRATGGRRTVDLLAAEPLLGEVAAWRAGVAAPPAASRPEEP